MAAILDDLRAAWGASAPTYRLDVVAHPSRVRRVWHYVGDALGLFGKPHSACLAQVKAWQRLHIAAPREWGDIGYNVLICPHARAIEGRGLSLAGAHCPGWNHDGWGIQYMVGGAEEPTPAMYERGRRLAQDLEALAGHDLTDHGHRESPQVSTSCPGPLILAWVHAGGPETLSPNQEDDMFTEQDRKDLKYGNVQNKALAELIIEMSKREAARDAAYQASLEGLVKSMASGQPVDLDAVRQVAHDGAQAGIADALAAAAAGAKGGTA